MFSILSANFKVFLSVKSCFCMLSHFEKGRDNAKFQQLARPTLKKSLTESFEPLVCATSAEAASIFKPGCKSPVKRERNMQILKSVVGRKIFMAITGQCMVLFAVVHMMGNSSIFVGPDGINAYAKHLHDLGPLVWVFRAGLFAFVAIHIFYGIQLTLENSAANPTGYAVKKQLKATFASANMIWTGLLIALLHYLPYSAFHRQGNSRGCSGR